MGVHRNEVESKCWKKLGGGVKARSHQTFSASRSESVELFALALSPWYHGVARCGKSQKSGCVVVVFFKMTNAAIIVMLKF